MTIRSAAWAAVAFLAVAAAAEAQTSAYQYGYSAPFRTSYSGGMRSTFVPTYSYYAAYPYPARGYAGLRDDAFPFYGWPPYGHPYDRWSWAYLGGYYNGLNRYFYEPLP